MLCIFLYIGNFVTKICSEIFMYRYRKFCNKNKLCIFYVYQLLAILIGKVKKKGTRVYS
jgi:hypothetical protein